jgi:hypothetical protein
MEFDVFAQIKTHGRGVDVGPAGGQGGFYFVVFVVAHQTLVGMAHDVVGGGVVLGMGVERQDVVLGGPFEFGGLCNRHTQQACRYAYRKR